MCKCWNCSCVQSEIYLFCHSCQAIQPTAKINHFVRLGLQPGFDIDLKHLESAYFGLQVKLHPDRFAKKSEKEKIFSMQQSMDVNAAYETLKNPLARAEYMLKLQGIIVNADNATVKPSQVVLQEAMEAQERLAETSAPSELNKFLTEVAAQKLSLISTLSDNFAKGALEDAAQNTIKLKYLEKLNEEIKRALSKG